MEQDQEMFRKWASRNGWEILERDDGEHLIASDGSGREVHYDQYGNVQLVVRKLLGGEAGVVWVAGDRLYITDSRGKTSIVGGGAFPV